MANDNYDVTKAQRKVAELDRDALQLADKIATGECSEDDIKRYTETRETQSRLKTEIDDARTEADFAAEAAELRKTADERKLNAQMIEDASTIGSAVREALSGGKSVRLSAPEFVNSNQYHQEVRVEEGTGERRLRTVIHAPEALHTSRMFGMNTDLNQIDTVASTRGYATSVIGAGVTNAPVPTLYWPNLVELMRSSGPMLRDDCFMQIDTPTLEPITVYTQNAHSGAAQKAESADVQSDPAIGFGKETLNAYKIAGGALVTEEMLRSTHLPSFLPLIGREIANSVGFEVNEALTTADGSSKPQGLVTALGSAQTIQPLTKGANATTFSAKPEELLTAVGEIDEAYEENAKFMLNKKALWKFLTYTSDDLFTMFTAQSMANASGIHRTSASELTNAPSTRMYMLGTEPAFTNPHMPNDYSANKTLAVYGNGDYFWVRRSDIVIGDSEHPQFMKFQTSVRVAMWVDSVLTQPTAFRKINTKT